MKKFNEIRENWDKDEEKAFANTLYYLAKKGTRGSIKAGRMLVKAGKLTGRALDKIGDYLGKKIIAIAVPGMAIQDLQHLKDMGVPIPGYAYDRLKKSESTDKDEKSL